MRIIHVHVYDILGASPQTSYIQIYKQFLFQNDNKTQMITFCTQFFQEKNTGNKVYDISRAMPRSFDIRIHT